MKVYVAHSKDNNYVAELYKPIRNHINKEGVKIVLPHEHNEKPYNSKQFLKECSLVIAEVSSASTGLGIELGWASFMNIPIVCIHKAEANISNSLKVITNKFYKYANEEELVSILSNVILKER